MKKLQFKCTLLSDVVISEKTATEGGHRSLDFIPGNNFLGIAATTLYNKEDATTRLIFHSGKVRFGDAHPAFGGIRTLRTPACLYYPKLKKLEEECYVQYLTNMGDDAIRAKQLKQARKDFCAFKDQDATIVKVEKIFSIKSAYDRTMRRSEDEKMFGYESIAKGTEFYFEVELDAEAEPYEKEIADALTGRHHLGRSRSAQYGWVDIKQTAFTEPSSGKKSSNSVVVYADSRLIFFDDNGMPTFQPSPKDLGIDDKNAEIDWSKSQVRTFQYAPWNFKRQAFDSDRVGIEKGSVFVVKTTSDVFETAYVGDYQNEGFGKVIYNPSFLRAESDGRSVLKFQVAPKPGEGVETTEAPTAENKLLRKFLEKRRQEQKNEKNTYERVKAFVDANKDLFKGERFASQWGTIRGIAMATEDPAKIQENIETYLNHGVTKEQWDDRGRAKTLLYFLGHNTSGVDLQDFVINLASEMAKKLRNND